MIDFLAEPPDEHGAPDLDEDLRAPVPYFGGKRRIASLVWERFGDVVNFVEPFCGSAAVLLARPAGHLARVETVNDVDGLVSNFFRAVQADPGSVARFCDYPVIEVDLHARHRALIAARPDVAAKLEGDPRWFDAELAGWWAWGASCWIGAGWCSGSVRQTPDLSPGQAGVHGRGVTRRLPDVGAGRNWDGESPQARDGKGVHGGAMRLPSVGASGVDGTSHGTRGVHGLEMRSQLYDVLARLAARLRYVRIVCGDWSRVCTPAVTWRHGLTGVFLDPPYGDGARTSRVYAADSMTVAADVRAWAHEAGKHHHMRIALCGYDGEHDELQAAGWSVVAWKAHGGYGSQGNGAGRANARRERVWFSPACLRAAQGDLFEGRNAAGEEHR